MFTISSLGLGRKLPQYSGQRWRLSVSPSIAAEEMSGPGGADASSKSKKKNKKRKGSNAVKVEGTNGEGMNGEVINGGVVGNGDVVQSEDEVEDLKEELEEKEGGEEGGSVCLSLSGRIDLLCLST